MRVARRDASSYDTHRHTTTALYAHVPVWHAINPDDPYLSRCGRFIDVTTEREYNGLAAACGRPGCKQAFEAAFPTTGRHPAS